MGLIVHQELIDKEKAEILVNLCPFNAIAYDGNKLDITAACKSCRMCVNKGPSGCITFEEDKIRKDEKDEYKGILVYADCNSGKIHPVAYELLGKAKELCKVINHPLYALMIGHNLENEAQSLLEYGADRVFVYDDEKLKDFDVESYTDCLADFIERYKPSSVLVGATNLGRCLAPRVAARFETGLTADCTKLEMKENTDLVQIRPAFGGNIMARIVNPNRRPQFATVRYKVFDKPLKSEVHGEVINLEVKKEWLETSQDIIEVINKPKEEDIAEAEVIVAVGRGLKSKSDLDMVNELADLLNASVACSRPMVENGIFEAKYQIGLSGKTVKPKLIITLGISGAIQFTSGMKSSDCIIAVNNDPNAQIFDVANYCVTGDMYKIVPDLIKKIREGK
ncbi:MAG: electron transfer flavoprotein subunit alpha/FixB family protein [Erysipelotrichaceae bacterium]|nr:electron transfer flavoprotein subunit alpha/FixB family protein [Erysipelotrichaceae bacterium]